MKVDTVIYARWIIPVEPSGTRYENYAIAITGDKLTAVLPAALARQQCNAKHEYHLDNHVLIPGLINAHTHAAMTLLRGYAEDLALLEWLNQRIWPVEQKWVSREFVHAGTQLALAEMLRGGITCFNDMYFFPDCTAAACAAVGARAVVGLILLKFPTVWATDADEYISKAHTVHNHYRNHPLINTALAPHAPYTVSDDSLRRANTLAAEFAVPVHMHIHETAAEITESMQQYGKRPLQRLADLGLLTPRLLAVHMTQLTPAEISTLAESGVSVVHCPKSNLKLASGFCPVADLHAAGVNVCIGTDGAASNNNLDMLGELQTAALLAKGVAKNSSVMDTDTILQLATLNGARALHLDEAIGSLKVGKQADIVAIDLNSIETQPIYDPLAQIIYAAQRDQVSDVWIAGKQVLKNRVLTTIDEPALMAIARNWQAKISAAS